MKNIMYWITLVIAILAVIGASQLSYTDWKEGNVCPQQLGIPACYIVLAFFVAATISHLTKTSLGNTLFFIFMAFPLFLALKGSITELSGTVVCPRTSSGIPMCFISLGLCISLIGSKYFSL